MAIYYGYNVPFLTDGQVLPFQTDERLIKNDLLQLLLTNPGERVMRPTYGTPIKQFLFEPMTAADIDMLRTDIAESIRNNEQRVLLKDIVINTTEDENLMSILIYCSLTIDPNRSLEIFLDLRENQ